VKAELERRGASERDLAIPEKGRPWEASSLVVDARNVLRHSSYQPVRQAIQGGEFAVGVRLPGFAGLLAHPTQLGVTFAREIADRVRVIACPVRQPFMTHSDLGVESLEGSRWNQLGKALGAGLGDAIIVAWAPEEDAATAAREILLRAREAIVGIPAETRQAFPDGTTGFERILPGADRMYPDTDTPPLPTPDSEIVAVRGQMGETPWAREDRYRSLGLSPAMAQRLAASPWANLFDEVAPMAGEVARRLAGVLEKRIPFHARCRGRPRRPDWGEAEGETLPPVRRISPLVRALEKERIRPEALGWALNDALEDPGRALGEILKAYRPLQADGPAVRKVVREVVGNAQSMPGRSPDVWVRWAMGEVMRELFGRVDPREIRRQLGLALGRVEEDAS